MPMYMDIHEVRGVTSSDVAKAHMLDLHTQAHRGVEYVKYWVNEKHRKIFCLCHAPSADAADAVHREAHGLTAARIMEVTQEIDDAFRGAAEVDQGCAVLLPDKAEHDPGTRTILFTDIVGSTDLTQQLGDDVAFNMLGLHDRVVRAALAANNGREVKHTGDGIMAAFHSAASAVRCGMTVQQNICQQRDTNPKAPLRVRIGIAAGEPIEHHNDLFGSTVQLAARLCGRAEPEQILVSNTVAELCIGKSLPLRDVGQVALKGFDQPVSAH